LVIKWVSRPNKEKYAYRHTCPFILLPYVVTYPLNSLLIFLEQFCHPLPNELDHCAAEVWLKVLQRFDSWKCSWLSLEHNLFKNVSNWVTFLWQTQIQTIKYDLNDTKRIKKKPVTLILYTLRYEFSNDFDAQSDFGNFFVTKNLLTWTILILSML